MNIKNIFGWFIIVIGVIGCLYISIWWGLVLPIENILDAIDNNTDISIGWEVAKILLREFFAGVFAIITFSIGFIFLD